MKHLPTVLLVDDNPHDAVLFRFAVAERDLALQVRMAKDGREAIAYLSGEDCFADRAEFPLPGLVLLDLHMPGIDGLTVLRWIRKEPQLAGLPVIVLTGSDDYRSSSESLEKGADLYVVKDSAPTELMALLGQMNLGWTPSGPRKFKAQPLTAAA